jgi:hypothetical protein
MQRWAAHTHTQQTGDEQPRWPFASQMASPRPANDHQPTQQVQHAAPHADKRGQRTYVPQRSAEEGGQANVHANAARLMCALYGVQQLPAAVRKHARRKGGGDRGSTPTATTSAPAAATSTTSAANTTAAAGNGPCAAAPQPSRPIAAGPTAPRGRPRRGSTGARGRHRAGCPVAASGCRRRRRGPHRRHCTQGPGGPPLAPPGAGSRGARGVT